MTFKELRKGMKINFSGEDNFTIQEIEHNTYRNSIRVTLQSPRDENAYMFGAPGDDIKDNWKASVLPDEEHILHLHW